MSKQLNIEDLLEILEESNHPFHPVIRVRLERLTQYAAELVAETTGTEHGLATWQGKAFAGCCVSFHPKTEDQPVPPVFVETMADPDGDWEVKEYGPELEDET